MREGREAGRDVPDAADLYDGLPQYDVDVHGHRVHLVDAGQGPTVLMVHGSPVSSFSFRHQIAALREKFRVVAPDLVGFGRSSAPDCGADFGLQAEVLRGLMDELALDDLRLVAHDWGGPIALAATAQRPEQLRRLVLINTSALPDFKPPLYWRVFIGPGIGELLFVRLNLFARGLPFLLRASRRADIRRIYTTPFHREGTRRTVLALERLAGFREQTERVISALGMMRVPTLLLWGHPDPYFRERELERMRSTFHWAALRVLPRGGHFPQEDLPEDLTSSLCEFIE